MNTLNQVKLKTSLRIATFTLMGVFILTMIAFAGKETTTMKDVKQKTKEALETIGQYSAEQRDEAVRDVNKMISEMDADIERLQKRIDQKMGEMDQATRQKAKATLKTLRKKRNNMAEWLGGVKHSSAGAWDEVKSGFVNSYQELKKSFDEAAKEF